MFKPVRKFNYPLILGSCLSGTILGHIYGRIRSNPDTSEFMVPYESEDQVYHLLETTNKPVVIYYYFGYSSQFPQFRRALTSYSYKHHDKCTWIMASYKKNAFHVNNNLKNVGNEAPLLQIRFPKQKFHSMRQDGSVESKIVYPTQLFNGGVDFRQLRHFFQTFGLIGVNDGVKGLRDASQEVIFGEVLTK